MNVLRAKMDFSRQGRNLAMLVVMMLFPFPVFKDSSRDLVSGLLLAAIYQKSLATLNT